MNKLINLSLVLMNSVEEILDEDVVVYCGSMWILEEDILFIERLVY